MDKEKNNQLPEKVSAEEELLKLMPDMTEEEIAAGLEEIAREHEDVDAEALIADADFMLFAKGKSGDLAGVYADYLALTESVWKKAETKFKVKQNRSTGSGRAATGAPAGGLNDAQSHFLSEWNREHPEYAISAKEYAAALKA
jgi:hypothetical protein